MNTEELTALYRTHGPLVHARARRILGSEADDVVQEVFLRLLRRPAPAGHVDEWVGSLTTNVCLDRLRRQRIRDERWQGEVRAFVEERGAGLSSEALLSNKELCRKVLQRADSRTRTIATLVYLDEMTQEEAASSAGVSRKTVTERLGRFTLNARKLVERWLKDI